MNKLNAMATFVQIIDSGSLTAAAETIDTSLPTVVRTLASLENHLNTRLLNRTTRSITLTDEGRSYLERCRHILSEIEEAELALSAQQSKPSGKLRVTAPVMFGSLRVVPLISRFLQQNDRVEADLLLLDRNVNLVDEGIDVAIRIGPLSDSSMIAKEVGRIRRLVCGTPELLNSIGPIKNPRDLSKLPCIRHPGLGDGGSWHFYEKDKTHTIPIGGPLVCNLVAASIVAVRASLGLGMCLSYQVEDQLASGELQVVLADYEPPPLPVSVVFSHTKLMSTRVRVFVDWITRELRREFSAG